MHWFWGHYLNDAGDLDNPYVVPMKAKSLSGLPPALIISAGYDFLRDEDEAYGRKLAEDGVRVTMTRYPGMIHGFFGMAGILDDADVALAEAADALGRAFRFAGNAVVA
jgi:acetyl esterase